ncbi:hypothetical protein INS49_013562 [Diaporthe citri]|uniref:uncharacterized protein n=1 Tax=Diaporthe citri TaxID=83186 RepID=UPI001C803AC6|nr:uncharacterized protein INS49_013562 [Diaporthe citri]KAG6357683.1 hypothetical protein INS49_013562 [Diaporthe citri]
MRAISGPNGFQTSFVTVELSGASVVVALTLSSSSRYSTIAGRRGPDLPREFIGSISELGINLSIYKKMPVAKGTILVTGANGGLGSAIAEQIASKAELSAYHGLYTVRDAEHAPALTSARRLVPRSDEAR